MVFSQHNVDDEALKAYLLGDLPRDESERVEEKSVTDDDFAARLDGVEADLVDAYVRGELTGEAREKFQKIYRSSARLRQRVAFAENLQPHLSQRAVVPASQKAVRSSWLNLLRMPRLALAGGLAALLAIGAVVWQLPHLKESRDQTAANQAARQQPNAEQPASTKPALEAAPRAETSQGAVTHLPTAPLSVVAFVLAPPMRGAAQVPTLALTQVTSRVNFHLELETNDFPHYRVTLKNLKADNSLWQSSELDPVTKGDSSTLSLRVPAKLLQQGLYKLDLAGIPANGEAEFVSSYVFRVATH
jgi:hypothetical protein